MAGYHPAGPIPDYIVNPETRHTVDEWMEILYPSQPKPWWVPLMKIWARWKYGSWRKHGK